MHNVDCGWLGVIEDNVSKIDSGVVNSLQPLDDPLVPLYFNVLDSILLQKSKDALRDLVGGVGGGRAGIDGNPNHNGTKRLLSVLSVGDEAGGSDGEAILGTAPH